MVMVINNVPAETLYPESKSFLTILMAMTPSAPIYLLNDFN